MLKNILSSLGMASIVATSAFYMQKPISVTTEVLGAQTTIPMIASATMSTTNPEYSVAGQSGQVQVIEPASKSGEIAITITPESAKATIAKPSPSPTVGAADELVVSIEPAIKNPEPSPTPVPTPITTPKPSAVPSAEEKAVVQLPAHELDALFQKYGAEYGVSWEKLKAIAKCESGFNAAVVSKNGLYGGLFQYVASTWSGTRKQMGLDPDPALRFNAEEAIRTTAYKISVGGTGPWPHCGKK